MKEAVQKSTQENLVLNKIETSHFKSKPIIKIKNTKNRYNFITSISHENDYAIAIALSKKIK